MKATTDKRKRICIALLDTMWDWRAMTSSAGYKEKAPTHYLINPRNLSGSRLYRLIGPRGSRFDLLWAMNSCPELVNASNRHGTPDPRWVSDNLKRLWPFDCILVCGKVAQETFTQVEMPGIARIISMPHPAARNWTTSGLEFASRLIQGGNSNLDLRIHSGKLRAYSRKLPW